MSTKLFFSSLNKILKNKLLFNIIIFIIFGYLALYLYKHILNINIEGNTGLTGENNNDNDENNLPCNICVNKKCTVKNLECQIKNLTDRVEKIYKEMQYKENK